MTFSVLGLVFFYNDLASEFRKSQVQIN